jgi:hypothetical protein
MWTENLDNYLKSKPTNSCYLDGRYFYKVLLGYPGTIPEPLRLYISKKRNQEIQIAAEMKTSNIDTSVSGLLRVVIQTPRSRHCNLLILDYQKGIAYRFEPHGVDSLYENEINTAIENYLAFFLDMKIETLDVDLPEEQTPQCLATGQASGFCTAYIIMLAYAYINNKNYRFDQPRRFAAHVEEMYGSLPKDGAEIEYGLFDGRGVNPEPGKMALGGAIGLGAGALLGGASGAALGGLGGIAVGSLL